MLYASSSTDSTLLIRPPAQTVCMALEAQCRLFDCSTLSMLRGGGATERQADLLLLSMRETSLTHMSRTADNQTLSAQLSSL